jgi:drug/metabolite transporter (DMT)-like permease
MKMAKAQEKFERPRLVGQALPAKQASTVAIVMAFAAVYVIWGSTYLAIRFAIETLPPFLMAGTRFLIAGSVLFVWSGFRGASIRQSLAQWRRALILGALLLLCGNGGVTWAEKYIASGLAALLVATEPLWVVMLNWILTHRRPNAKVLFGVVIGLAGVALLVGGGLREGSAGPTMTLVGVAAIIAATFAWASGSIYANRNPIKATTTMASGMQMLAGGLLLLLMGVLTGDLKQLNVGRVSWLSIASLSYLIVFGSIIVFTAYSWLLRNVSPARAATYAYVNPVVAVFLGWLLANEPVSLRTPVAAAVIIISVVLITTFGEDQKPAESTATKPSLDGGGETEEEPCPTHPCA